MANKLTTMLHIRRIIQFRLQGKSNREIAMGLHKSRNNVNEYVKRIESTSRDMAELLAMTDEELSSHLYTSNLSWSNLWPAEKHVTLSVMVYHVKFMM